jgi:DNA-binding NtrC family response regulator
MAQREVLIVEEDAQVRGVLSQIFVGAGYKCQLASNGGERLEVFRGSRPSPVVTDLGMPMVWGGLSVRDAGIRLLQQILQEDPDAAVIVASGAADVKTAIRSLKLGAYAFLMKPVIVDELLIIAGRALERRQLLIERRQYQTTLERLGSALETTKAEVQRCPGTHFDPGVVASFFKVPEALLEEIRRRSVEG